MITPWGAADVAYMLCAMRRNSAARTCYAPAVCYAMRAYYAAILCRWFSSPSLMLMPADWSIFSAISMMPFCQLCFLSLLSPALFSFMMPICRYFFYFILITFFAFAYFHFSLLSYFAFFDFSLLSPLIFSLLPHYFRFRCCYIKLLLTFLLLIWPCRCWYTLLSVSATRRFDAICCFLSLMMPLRAMPLPLRHELLVCCWIRWLLLILPIGFADGADEPRHFIADIASDATFRVLPDYELYFAAYEIRCRHRRHCLRYFADWCRHADAAISADISCYIILPPCFHIRFQIIFPPACVIILFSLSLFYCYYFHAIIYILRHLITFVVIIIFFMLRFIFFIWMLYQYFILLKNIATISLFRFRLSRFSPRATPIFLRRRLTPSRRRRRHAAAADFFRLPLRRFSRAMPLCRHWSAYLQARNIRHAAFAITSPCCLLFWFHFAPCHASIERFYFRHMLAFTPALCLYAY